MADDERGAMEADDHVCLCYKVSLRKLVNYMEREQPRYPSQLSDCLGAGTGCQWCVPYLEQLYERWKNGETPMLEVAPSVYATLRKSYLADGRRPGEESSD